MRPMDVQGRRRSGLRDVVLICAIVFAQRSGGTAVIAYALLVGLALGGGIWSVKALTLGWLGLLSNPAILPGSPQAGTLRWVVVGAALAGTLRVAAFQRTGLRAPWGRLLLFAGFAAAMARVVSAYPDVSLFKSLAFAAAVLAALLGTEQDIVETRQLESWLWHLYLAVLSLSVPLVAIHSIGYFRNGTGFQGILNHPQALGVFLGILLPWAALRAAESEATKAWQFGSWGAIAVGAFALLLTQSRTGVLGALGSIAIVGVSLLLRRPGRLVRPSVVLAGLAFVALVGVKWGSVQRFLQKRPSDTPLSDAYQRARGKKMEDSWRDFLRSPIVGNGFGAPSPDVEVIVHYNKLLHIPVGAPVEKGFAVTALLEDVGVLGAALFLILVVGMHRDVRAGGSLAALGLFWAALLVNLGESTIFAPGGIGILVWIALGYARATGVRAGFARGERRSRGVPTQPQRSHVGGGA